MLRVEATGDYLLLAQSVDHPDAAVFRVHLLVTRTGTTKLWPVRMPVNGDDFPSARQQRALLADAAGGLGDLPMARGTRGRWTGDDSRISRTSRLAGGVDVRLVHRAFEGATITTPGPAPPRHPAVDD